MTVRLDCPVCGYSFNPAAEAACLSCPLKGGCALVCCPACGHVTVDETRSRLARVVTPFVRHDHPSGRAGGRTLSDVPAGETARIAGFTAGFDGGRREQLQAYGLSPGRNVVVVQQRPVTVVRVDHTEIALESDIGTLVEVEPEPGRA